MRLFYKNAKMEHNATINFIVDIVSFVLSLTRNHEGKCGKTTADRERPNFRIMLIFRNP